MDYVYARCTKSNCQAIGKGETFEEACNNVDHAIALHRDPLPGSPYRGCAGFKEFCEEVTKTKDDKFVPKEKQTPKKESPKTPSKSDKEKSDDDEAPAQ